MIAVTTLFGLDRALARFKPRFLVSLLDPGSMIAPSDRILPGEHFRIECHDTLATSNRKGFPNEEVVQKLLALGSRWSGHDRLLTHCIAAQSRSPAAAIILLAQKNPGYEERIARLVARKLPQARPNPRLIEAGDRLLGLNGRLISAVKAMPEPTLRDFQDRYASISVFLGREEQ